MKINKKIFFILFGMILIIGFYFLAKERPGAEKRISKNFEKMPDFVKESILTSDFQEEKYEQTIKTMNVSVTEHKMLGEELYTQAMGTSMYSKDKLKLLKMAKIHLLKAKELGL